MALVIHIAEVAAILAVAYVVGWLIGYLARRYAASRPRRLEMPAEIAAAVAAATDADALVKAPEIVPVAASAPQPVEPPAAAPQPELAPVATDPAPAIIEAVAPTTVLVEPSPAPVPAEPPAPAAQSAAPQPLPKAIPLPIRTTLPPMDIPPMDLSPIVAPPPMRIEPLARTPKAPPLPELAPLPEPEPTVPFTATPAMRPGEAWSGAIRGRSAAPEPAPAPSAEVFAQPPIKVPVTLELTETVAFVAEPEPVTEGPVEPESTIKAPQIVVETPPAPSPAPAPSAVPYDEDAAMRAIEGGWSRVKTRALPNSPELSDVGAAVAAAQSAVEQVLAQAGIDTESPPRASKPAGLALPRAGRKDDLKRINGLGALDESTLNNLGVFHFDQIAAWDETQVFWMENHVFARGRIGHEKWQQQARELAAAVAG